MKEEMDKLKYLIRGELTPQLLESLDKEGYDLVTVTPTNNSIFKLRDTAKKVNLNDVIKQMSENYIKEDISWLTNYVKEFTEKEYGKLYPYLSMSNNINLFKAICAICSLRGTNFNEYMELTID